MANSKRVFTLHNPHGQRSLSFTWQNGSGGFLASTGYNMVVSIHNRHGEVQEQIRLPGTCTGLEWDNDGDLLAAITDKSSTLVLWDAHTLKTFQLDTGLRDPLTLLIWGKSGPLLAVGTLRGNLLIYNHKSSRKIPIVGKHTKKITCGAWNQQNLLALGSEDKTLSISNQEGDTIRVATLRSEPSDIRFSEMKQDERSMGENTVSVVIGKKTLYLFNLNDPDNPIELAFQQKYGTIVTYEWFRDGYILIGFNLGFLVVLSTHLKEIGQELFQVKGYRECLTGLSVSYAIGKLATCGDNSVRIYEFSELKDTEEVLSLDEERSVDNISWSQDGQLLAVGGSSGNIHVFLMKLPVVGDVWGTRLTFLTSLLEVTIINPIEKDPPLLLVAEVEPNFIAVGAFHVALGMNNRAWFYTLSDTSAEFLCDREYLGTVESLRLNSDYASVLYEGKIQLHAIESDGSVSEDRETRLFPDPDVTSLVVISAHALTQDFLIYSTKQGKLFYFLLEDWKVSTEFQHTTGIKAIFTEMTGSRLIIFDDKAQGFVYNPVSNQSATIPDFPVKAKGALWETWAADRCVFVIFDHDTVHTFVYCRESVDGGSTVEKVASTRLPIGQVPLLLFNGEITLQTPGGRLNNLVLSSHELATPNVQDHQEAELRVGLHKNLALKRFKDAWTVCQVLDNKEDWISLAKSAMKNLDVELAVRVYRHIGDVAMVWSLEDARDIEDKHLLAGHLAMIIGDFDKAQELFLQSSDPMCALELCQDLMRWEDALQLAKKLAADRIPHISREYAQQLEFTGDYPNALNHYQQGLVDEASSRANEQNRVCFAGISRTALRCGDVRKGVAIALEQNSRSLKKECGEILEGLKQYAEAAMLYERGQYFDKAASLFIRIKNWHKVGELLPNVSSPKIHLQYAKAKEADGRYPEAVKAYEAARDFENVIRIQLDHLNNPDEAVRIVRESRSTEGAKMVARFFQNLNDYNSAIQFLVLSQCNEEAFSLAQSHGKMELYAEVVGSEASVDDYLSIANHFHGEKHYFLAGKFFYLAGEYQKALHHLLRASQSNSEDTDSLQLAIDVVGASGDEQLSHLLIQFLLGEKDGIPKDPKYLFRLYMALKQPRESAKTAVIIAHEEQNAGNYSDAHDVLFSMYQELREQGISVPNEMQSSMALLHSYILVRLHSRRQDHKRAAKLLARVANNISKFPAHQVNILTSAVIKCQRAGYKSVAFNFAVMLLRPEHRSSIDERYRRKIEVIVRKPPADNDDMEDGSGSNGPALPCPVCKAPLAEMILNCSHCKNTLPFCIITGSHIIAGDLCECPHCHFPAIRTEFLQIVESGEPCPMCKENVNLIDLKSIPNVDQFLNSGNDA